MSARQASLQAQSGPEDNIRPKKRRSPFIFEKSVFSRYKRQRIITCSENHDYELNDKGEDSELSLRSLLDDPGQHLADASSTVIDQESPLVFEPDFEPDLTVEEVGRLFDDHDNDGGNLSEAQSQSKNSTVFTDEACYQRMGWLESSLESTENEDALLENPNLTSVQSEHYSNRKRKHGIARLLDIPSNKRFGSNSEELTDPPGNVSVSGTDTSFDDTPHQSPKPSRESTIDIPDFVYPRSQHGLPPPMDVSREKDVVLEFLNQELEHQEQDNNEEDYIEYELTDFSIYVQGHVEYLGYELVSLNNLGSKSMSTLLFDGILRHGNTQRYVEGIPFERCPIGNYGEDFHEVGGDIWIQSVLNNSREIYYRLKNPAPEYQRFHEGFVWVANLAKYFVDFLVSLAERGELATSHHFQAKFMKYLVSKHGSERCFQDWHRSYKASDFRTAVNAHIEFLYHQAIGVDEDLEEHTIWSELRDFTFIPMQQQIENKTVVTPFVYKCFEKMNYRHLLKLQIPVLEIAKRRLSRGSDLHMPVATDLGTGLSSPYLKFNSSKTNQDFISKESAGLFREKIFPGDVLAVVADSEEARHWKGTDQTWYVYVTKVKRTPSGRQILNILWLYKPADTICGNGRYPFDNELFMSDHCNCEHDVEIDESVVICKVSVAFHSGPTESGKDFFIRSTYHEEEHSFVTFKDQHRYCVHHKTEETPFEKIINNYQKGETVLVAVSESRLDPCEIVEFMHHPDYSVLLRILRRRSEVDESSHARPNELVYTDELFETSAANVVKKCFVRFYAPKDLQENKIPAPYNRNGTGDAFFITTRLKERSLTPTTSDEPDTELVPIESDKPATLIEGFDPDSNPDREKLRGLDLFCGGGNFGRGLAEGGAVSNRWAVDLNKHALHTYAANLEEHAKTSLFLGSVDDMLSQAMEGNPRKSPLIPIPGDVEFIAAGNPCVGFSRLNSNRENEKGLKNQSFVASVAAYVDFYRPKYAFLENVITMASSMSSGKNSNPLSQLVCTMVGIGYHVQLFKIDAWSCGSPQSRSRLFVSLAAPGYELPPYPALSHSHPSSTKKQTLGRAANGEGFGLRQFGPTAFKFISAAEATQDLPNIDDAQTKMCIPYPDHVVPKHSLSQLRAQIKLIPRYPRGMNLYKTFSAGRTGGLITNPRAILMTDAEAKLFGAQKTKYNTLREAFKNGSKSYGRMKPDKPFPCAICVLVLPCSRAGTIIHWDQPRAQTIMEARRAQDIPDHEVLVGSRPAQFRCIGNSVPRSISLALGLSLRSVWLKNAIHTLSDDDMLEEQFQSTFNSLGIQYSPPSVSVSNKSKKRKTAPPIVPSITDADSVSIKSYASSVQDAFSSLLEAIREDEPIRFAKEQVRLRSKHFEMVIRPINEEEEEADSNYDSSSKTGKKRGRS